MPHIFSWKHTGLATTNYRVKRETIVRISRNTSTSRGLSNEWYGRARSQQLKNTQELRSSVPAHRSSTKPWARVYKLRKRKGTRGELTWYERPHLQEEQREGKHEHPSEFVPSPTCRNRPMRAHERARSEPCSNKTPDSVIPWKPGWGGGFAHAQPGRDDWPGNQTPIPYISRAWLRGMQGTKHALSVKMVMGTRNPSTWWILTDTETGMERILYPWICYWENSCTHRVWRVRVWMYTTHTHLPAGNKYPQK